MSETRKVFFAAAIVFALFASLALLIWYYFSPFAPAFAAPFSVAGAFFAAVAVLGLVIGASES